MFRRKKPSTPAASPDMEMYPGESGDGPRVTAFPAREPRLEPVRSPEAGAMTAPARRNAPQQETPASMADKPSQPTGPVSTGPSPPARNPLSHLPHIGDPARRPAYPGLPPASGGERPRPVVEGRKLIVGRDIVLTGSIAACDTLVVEGRVESDLNGASVIDVTATGTFQGSADVDHADIAGTFDGQLTVHKKLSLSRSGRITGTVRYAAIEIETGGQIQGVLEVIGQPAPIPAGKSEKGD